MDSALMERLTRNAEHLMSQYPRADLLLKASMQEAVPWAMPLYMQGRVPALANVERLATQLLAILMASEPDNARTT